jgi:Na+-driven multidrug efflux pump
MVSNLAEGITVLFMNHLAFRCYGEVGVSALTVVTYVQVLISMVFMGFTSAVEPIFSYHYGSGNVEMRQRVFRLCIRWNLLLGAITMLLLFLLRFWLVGVFFDEGSEFYRIASHGYLLILPACLFIGTNIFGSGLFTAFGNGLVSALLSLSRSFVVLSCCLFGLTALFGGPGLWCAWPAAELISCFVTAFVLRKYRSRYQYA